MQSAHNPEACRKRFDKFIYSFQNGRESVGSSSSSSNSDSEEVTNGHLEEQPAMEKVKTTTTITLTSKKT